MTHQEAVTRRGIVYFVVPEGIDDPLRATGGNVFDRRVVAELGAIGWDAQTLLLDPDAAAHVGAALARLPAGALVLIDGLIAGRAPDAIACQADRLHVVVLAHMVSAAFPDADPQIVAGERRALRNARRVIATSEWTRDELARRGIVAPDRVDIAHPGSDEAPVANGTPAGCALLCVGVVAPHKGQDVLIDALAVLATDREWTCAIVGSLDADREFVDRVAALSRAAGIGDRITMTGVLTGTALERAYQATDLLVAPSRVESYGMAIADALRRGVPVIASSAGGIPQAVRSRAALLVPPDRPSALAEALREWMTDPGLRQRMTRWARNDRASLPSWRHTAERVAATLAGVR